MRTAIGGVGLLQLIIIFLAIYIGVLGFAFSFVRALTVKNQIIKILERYEGLENSRQIRNARGEDAFTEYFSKGGLMNTNITKANCEAMGFPEFIDGGVCVRAEYAAGGVKYTVATFMQIDIPFLQIFSNRIAVRGETHFIDLTWQTP